jgi:tetratricopeptide (TPR) repeat protein
MNTAAILFAALLAQTSPMNASPEAKAKAKVMLNEGSALYQSGDYTGALEKFKEARATYASPKIWFNIGQATRDLGRFDESMAAFEKFLMGASDASPDAIADARKATDELRPKLGQVRIECRSPGAEVNIDGRVVGQAPLLDPIWVMPGRHQITALSAEASPAVETVSVAAGT